MEGKSVVWMMIGGLGILFLGVMVVVLLLNEQGDPGLPLSSFPDVKVAHDVFGGPPKLSGHGV